MTFIPSLCTNPRLPQNLREISDDIWRNVPRPERRSVELPRAEWRDELREGHECIVIANRSKPALLAFDGRLAAASWLLGDSPEREMIFDLSISADNGFASDDAPAPGDALYVSADSRSRDLWMVWAFVCLTHELRDGPVQSVKTLEEAGLTFTGNFVNEASYWLSCRVLCVQPENDGSTILATIESVIWNESLYTGMSEVLAAANQRAREVRRIPASDPRARDANWLELERKLTNSDWEVRWSAIYGSQQTLTPEQIDRAQRDKKRMVRFAIAKRFDLELDPAQIEVGLTDQSIDVRDIYAYRGGYTLTPEQIERGLTDESELVRLRIASRPEVVGRFTGLQIERKLADACETLNKDEKHERRNRST
ncbi:MAG: hypothetical protein IT510_05410 [Sulfuritalea sp.]|nr:hypothetical protein [Sulfuritalea sp.]